jgi:hypothetical protein
VRFLRGARTSHLIPPDYRHTVAAVATPQCLLPLVVSTSLCRFLDPKKREKGSIRPQLHK